MKELEQKIAASIQRARKAVQRYQNIKQTLAAALNSIEVTLQKAEKNRARLLADGKNPDTEIKRIATERKKLEDDFVRAERDAVESCDAAFNSFDKTVGEIGGEIWGEWKPVRAEILATLERLDSIVTLGARADALARIVSKHFDQFEQINLTLPGGRGHLRRPKVPRLVRRPGWQNELKELAHNIRQALQ